MKRTTALLLAAGGLLLATLPAPAGAELRKVEARVRGMD